MTLLKNQVIIGLWAIIIALMIALYNINNDANQKIMLLKEDVAKIADTEKVLKKQINEHLIYISRLQDNLKFIYTRSDLPTTESWKEYILKNKDKAEKDLSLSN